MPPCKEKVPPGFLEEDDAFCQARENSPLRSTSTILKKGDDKLAQKILPSPHDPVLKWLYIILCYLCISMVVWIMISPASWLLERSTWHQEVLLPFLRANGSFRAIPEAVVTKYQGHTLVQFTHIVPAAIWATIVPFQLHPTWRNRHRKLHRILGYIFIMMVLLIAIGIGIIVQRKLTNTYDFPNDNLPPQNKLLDVGYPPGLAVLALWFWGTAWYAVYLARRTTHRYKHHYHHHQRWIIRHVAAGIFVAVQRFFYIPLAMMVLRFTHPPPDPIPAWLQRDIFGGAGNAAALTTILLGEYAIHRLSLMTGKQTESKKIS